MIERKLEIFRAAAMLGNFTDAAAVLGMSQPNVTHQLSRLEKELGVKLFERNGRNVALTPAGKALYAGCGQLFADSEKMIRTVQCAAAEQGYYTVGGTMTAGGYLLPELIAAYMCSHPSHRLGLKIANTREMEGLLASRNVDLALVEGPFQQNYFLSEEYCDDELVPVFAPGRYPPEFSLAEYMVKGGLLILRETGSGTRYYFDHFIREHGLPAPAAAGFMEVNSFDALKLLVRQNLGITVISRLAVRDELAVGWLECGRFTEGRVIRKLNFIYSPDAELDFVDGFIRFCRRRS